MESELNQALRRVFPTAAQVILHEQLVISRWGGGKYVEDHLFAYDERGRPLIPLRPLELPELQDALRQKYGGGYVTLQAS